GKPAVRYDIERHGNGLLANRAAIVAGDVIIDRATRTVHALQPDRVPDWHQERVNAPDLSSVATSVTTAPAVDVWRLHGSAKRYSLSNGFHSGAFTPDGRALLFPDRENGVSRLD